MEALRRLLDGSGLRIRQTDGEAIVVYAPAADGTARQPANGAAPRNVEDIPGARAGGADFSGYIGRLQKAILRTLCGNAAAQPGGYRLALRLEGVPGSTVHSIVSPEIGDALLGPHAASRCWVELPRHAIRAYA
ncbi:hypothetical protein G6F50_014437 [Rhizopus delemar]|uniref:Uncharacterized protein n=1 Tax=Rhizopus delemar TaxID=936053 RepID=A0A9P6Y6I9_9FUNG|nr:hypothetical protein G6F50_014437 [Rhizopus delemar]